MKKTISLIAFWLSIISIYAQSGKTTIGLTPFRANNYTQYEPGIYESVSSAFVESGRFTVVDRSVWSSIQQERELQKSEEFLESKIAEQGKSLGAEFIVVGSVNSVTTAYQNIVNSQNQIIGHYYTGSVSVSLKVVSVETGQATASTTISASSPFVFGGIGGASSPEQAVAQAEGGLKNKTRAWVGKAFPVKVKVLKVLEEKDNSGVKSVLISGGTGAGINTKNDMKIVFYEDMEVDGKKIARTIEIAKGRVMKIEDESFSECKIVGMPAEVKKSGLEIKRRLDEGKTLYVITTE